MTSFTNITFFVLTNVALASVCVADTWTVDDDGKADFNNIQAAIDVAADGDEILVMPGTYVSQFGTVVQMNGKAVWLHSSGGPDVTFIDGMKMVRGIMCIDGETSSTHIQGFTIRNAAASPYDWDGNGTIESWETSGGGMGNANSSPMVSDCKFLMNHAHNGGSGMLNYKSNPIISNCTFQGNMVGVNASGGGMYNRSNSNPQLANCSFSNNLATNGGGMYNYDGSSPSLTDCEFLKNSALFSGGGMYNRFLSSPTIVNTEFNGNMAEKGGGGMYNSSLSDPTITGCTFNGNSSAGDGGDGGAMGNLTSSPTLTNCTFTSNTVGTEGVGGAVSFRVGCQPTISECTFTGNGSSVAMSGGGLYFSFYCTSTISDSLINLNETELSGGGLYAEDYCDLSLNGCSIVSNTTGTSGSGLTGVLGNMIDLTDCTINQNTNTAGENFEISIHFDTLLTNNGTSVVGGMLNDAAVLRLEPESVLESNSNIQLTAPAATLIDVDSINTTASLVADGTLSRQGSLSINNSSGSLSSTALGDSIPLIQAGTLASEFGSVMFPTMPAGLGLQLVESVALNGPATLISMEVVAVEEAEFDVPVGATLPGPPVDVRSLDVDNDGADEIAFLFDGTPGSVAVYSVTGDGAAPVLIQGLQANVGNNPVDLDVADFNGDGLDDLLVANGSGSTLNVLLVSDGNRNNTHTFNVLTVNVSTNDQKLLTCAAVIDWDGDSDLDAVVGVDVISETIEDKYQVMLDIATNSPATGPSFDIPMFQIGSTYVADAPSCVDGVYGINPLAWGFVGGTTFGRLHRTDPARATLQVLGSLDGNKVTTIEVKDLDVNGGDGIVDLMASSGEAKSVYLLQGEVGVAEGFGELIPLNVGDIVTDVLAIDADRDGDVDYLMATPESNDSLVLLRNDGSTQARDQKLSGQSYNRQSISTVNPVSKITSGGLSDKDEEDDWSGGGNQDSGPLFAGTGGTMDQINIVIPSCVGDFNDDGAVDITDLLSLIAAWGTCESCPEDLNTDGVVDVSDLLAVIAAWGSC